MNVFPHTHFVIGYLLWAHKLSQRFHTNLEYSLMCHTATAEVILAHPVALPLGNSQTRGHPSDTHA